MDNDLNDIIASLMQYLLLSRGLEQSADTSLHTCWNNSVVIKINNSVTINMTRLSHDDALPIQKDVN